MALADYLNKRLTLANLKASNKTEALVIMLQHVSETCPSVEPQLALPVLLERESLGTTGIGEGVAIPHGKLPDLPELIVFVACSKDGVDFEALDNKPCRIFFLVLAPEGSVGLYLRVLTQISRVAREPDFCAAMLEAPDENALWSVLAGS